MPKPLSDKYIENPQTIGEKIRNRRLELSLLQKDVASILGVCEDSITGWENNRGEPQMQSYPKIFEFLGYFPFDIDTNTIGGQIKKYRYLNGLSQEHLANLLGINESTVFHFEKNKHKPMKGTLLKLKSLSIIP